jgi:hypothetical protein
MLPDPHAQITAFLVVFIVTALLIWGVGCVVRRFIRAITLGWLDHLAGFLLGLLKTAIVVWAACLSISSFPEQMVRDSFGRSVVYKAYGAMPDAFSLPAMEGIRDAVRGIRPGAGDGADEEGVGYGDSDDGEGASPGKQKNLPPPEKTGTTDT